MEIDGNNGMFTNVFEFVSFKKKKKKLPQLGYIIAVKSCNSPAQEDIKYANKNSGYLLK